MQRSKALIFLAGLICILATACSSQGLTREEWVASISDKGPLPEGCKPVLYRGGLIPIMEFLEGSGRHCVVHDFKQRKLIDLHDRSSQGNPGEDGVLSFFQSSNVDLDLRGHVISAAPFDNAMGISGPRSYLEISNLRVHNGIVQTPGAGSIGVRMARYKRPPPGYQQDWAAEDQPPMRKSRYVDESNKFDRTDPWDYQPPTKYIAEDLKINSGGRGIVMSGADNVIRNNVIEVDGNVAVYMYGPRPVIEGNTFIVHLDPRDVTTLPAILKLMDADGAIVRNNRFIVKGGMMAGLIPGKAEAAINLLSSKNVLIENNTIEHAKLLVRKDELSNTLEQGNTLK